MQRYEVLLLGAERFAIEADSYIVDDTGIRFFTEGPEQLLSPTSTLTYKPTCEVGRVAPEAWVAMRWLGDNNHGEA